MQFYNSRRKSKITKLEGAENAGKYVHGLQMYKIPPTDNITLEEFEEFAIDRLKGKLYIDVDFIEMKGAFKVYKFNYFSLYLDLFTYKMPIQSTSIS